VTEDERQRMPSADAEAGEADVCVAETATGHFNDDVVGIRNERRELFAAKRTSSGEKAITGSPSDGREHVVLRVTITLREVATWAGDD